MLKKAIFVYIFGHAFFINFKLFIMPLSDKKSSQLYGIVSDKIIDARVKISRLMQNDVKLGEQIDKILFELQFRRY